MVYLFLLFCAAGQKMKTKTNVMEKTTDTSTKTIAETTQEEVVKEEYNENAENGEAAIIEVSYNVNRFVYLKV